MNTCSTCHWWFRTDANDLRNLCIWHTGLKTAAVRKVDFGGQKPMRTTADFGCVDWKEDERVKVDE